MRVGWGWVEQSRPQSNCTEALPEGAIPLTFPISIVGIYVQSNLVPSVSHLKREKRGTTEEYPLDLYILLDVLLCSIAEYFYELCRILTSL